MRGLSQFFWGDKLGESMPAHDRPEHDLPHRHAVGADVTSDVDTQALESGFAKPTKGLYHKRREPVAHPLLLLASLAIPRCSSRTRGATHAGLNGSGKRIFFLSFMVMLFPNKVLTYATCGTSSNKSKNIDIA